MDRRTGERLGLHSPEPTQGVPEDERTEPWGSRHPKLMPKALRRRLKEYRERFPDRSSDDGD